MNPQPLILNDGQCVRLICCLLLTIPHLQLVTCCSRTEYLFKNRCCNRCLPGHRVLRHCTLSIQTACGRCSGATYMDHFNELETCYKCQVCDPVIGFGTTKKCTHQFNSVCSCKPSFFCKIKSRNGCLQCKKHYACPPGEGVKEPGTFVSDTLCQLCVNGTFSWRYSSTDICIQWRICEYLGKVQTQSGTPHSNTKCAYPTSIVLPIALVLSILVLGILIWWWKRELRDRFIILRRQHLDRIRRIQLREYVREIRKHVPRENDLTHSVAENEPSLSIISASPYESVTSVDKSETEVKEQMKIIKGASEQD